jgi:hypothetical protein
VVRRLHQSDSRKLSFGCAGHNNLHQLAACRAILCCRVNRDWPNTSNRSSFIQTVATDDLSVLFSYYTEEPRVREHHREDADETFGVGKILREIVVIGESTKSFKTDSSADFGVGWSSSTNYE